MSLKSNKAVKKLASSTDEKAKPLLNKILHEQFPKGKVAYFVVCDYMGIIEISCPIQWLQEAIIV